MFSSPLSQRRKYTRSSMRCRGSAAGRCPLAPCVSRSGVGCPWAPAVAPHERKSTGNTAITATRTRQILVKVARRLYIGFYDRISCSCRRDERERSIYIPQVPDTPTLPLYELEPAGASMPHDSAADHLHVKFHPNSPRGCGTKTTIIAKSYAKGG